MISRNRRLVTIYSLLAGAGAIGLPTAGRGQAGGTPKPLTMKIQDFGPVVVCMPYMLARVNGLFDQAGLALQINPPIFNAAATYNIVLQNQADIGYTGATPMIPLIQQGRPVKIIAIISRGFEIKIALTLQVMEALAKKGVTPDSPLATRVQALRGLRIASPAAGSTIDLGHRYSLKKNGLDPARDVTIQPIADMAGIIAAVRQGAVDGLVGTNATGVAQSVADGVTRLFIEYEKHDETLRVFPFNVLVASDDYIKGNQEAIRRLLIGFQAGKNAIRRGLTADERDKVKKQFFPDMNPDTYRSLVDATMPLLTGPMAASQEQLEVLIGMHNATADVPAKVTFSQMFDTRLAEAVERK